MEDNNEFDVSDDRDAQKRVLISIARRRGQPAFRRKLLVVYKSKCAITQTSFPEVLEAAHIIPYWNNRANHVTNGILLRSDIHTLFDRGLIAITNDYKVLINSELTDSEYANLMGIKLWIPEVDEMHPDVAALALHRKNSGFAE